ncbi:hypothetical protein J3A83DRAFT_1632104 [Scleroderma citrinum]
MGSTGVGKSTFIQSAVPPELHAEVKVGHSLQSETSEIQPFSWTTKDGTKVKLVDTPGFDDSRAGMTDTKVLKMISNFLVDEYQGDKSRLTGLVYVHRIIDPRMGGNAQRNLRMFWKLCGKDSMKNVVIVTTMWDMVTQGDGLRREEELKSSDELFKPLLDEGATIARHHRTPKSAANVIDYILGKNATIPQIVHEIVEQGKELKDTAAGTELHNEIQALLKQHSEEMETLKAEMRGMVLKGLAEERERTDQVIAKLLRELHELKGGIAIGNDPPPGYESISGLPAPDTGCIEDCSKLLGLVKEHKSTLAPKCLNIANSIASCTIDFADAVEESVKSIQSASLTLKLMLESQDVRSLWPFMGMDTCPKTQGTWTKAQHDMDNVTRDIETILLKYARRGMSKMIPKQIMNKDKEKRISKNHSISVCALHF